MAEHTIRYTAHLERDVAHAMKEHAKRHNLSYSLAINNTLKKALFPEYQEEHNAALMAGLDRIEYQLKELRTHQRDDSTMLKEMLGTFVRVWFNNTAPVPEEQRRNAARSGGARFERFLDRIVDQIDRRQSVLDRTPQSREFTANDYNDADEEPHEGQ